MSKLLQEIRGALTAGEFEKAERLIAQLPDTLQSIPEDLRADAAKQVLEDLRFCQQLAQVQRSHLLAQWIELSAAERYRARPDHERSRQWEA